MNAKLIQNMIDALDEASSKIFKAYKALEVAKDSGIHVNLAAQKKELVNLCDQLDELSMYYGRELENRQNGEQ